MSQMREPDEICPHCGSDLFWQECYNCDEYGMSYHNCGEDTCCCLNPLPNVTCEVCDGKHGWYVCLSSCKEEKKKELLK